MAVRRANKNGVEGICIILYIYICWAQRMWIHALQDNPQFTYLHKPCIV